MKDLIDELRRESETIRDFDSEGSAMADLLDRACDALQQNAAEIEDWKRGAKSEADAGDAARLSLRNAADAIESQAREIERLESDRNRWESLAQKAWDSADKELTAGVIREIAALKAQPSGVVLPERLTYSQGVMDYVDGWNDAIYEVARLNQPASAGDERAAFEAWFAREIWKEGCYGNPDILKRQLWPCWQARAAISASHSEQVRQTAKFTLGDRVRKTKGSQWHGTVVGTYSTALTPEGYAVESSSELGSVQIYPAAALEACE